MSMKKIIILILAVTVAQITFGQVVTINPVEREVDKVPHKGMGVSIELDKKFVEKEWKKKIKEFGGKSSTLKGVTVIEGASISEISSGPIRILTKVEGGKGTTEVWWVLDLGTEYVVSGSSHWSAAKKALHDFGVQCYREDINDQISEAEKEYESTVKNLEKEEKEGVHLTEKVASNKSQIEKLKEENLRLEKEKEQNKKDQEQLKKDAETMKGKVETTKAKLDKVR